MVKLTIVFIVISACALHSTAYRNEFTFYTELDCKGDSLTLQSKQPDVVPEAPRILQTYQSYRVIGSWMAYQLTTFRGKRQVLYTEGESVCYNGTYHNVPDVHSVRHLAVLESTEPSIAFYEEVGFGNRETIITGHAFTGISHTTASVASTTNSTWILYTGDNFTGNAYCFTPGKYGVIWDLPSDLEHIKSVAKGCDRVTDFSITGDENINEE